ncbi:Hypothetical protein P9211_06871 [Prochlorococcus marinus str. MIT 9211]|uniref:Uncharacterized protein n=1 Tax=Prochlorococcus marinus (strain MIT 9211) TaxID=93059 RepID=A9B9V6_PROM4|nr:Hypothetical protein P9211_06871 [Prochlorococcus marinus str. MIT 9211]
MNDPLPDRTVILIILSTILLIFCFVFAFRPPQTQLDPAIQWKSSTLDNIENLST